MLPHPKGATQPSHHPQREREREPSNAAIDIWSSGEPSRNRVVYPALQRSQPDPTAPPLAAECLRGEELHLVEALTVILKSPMNSTGRSAATGAGRNAKSRQRDPAMFDITESITQLQDGDVPTRRT